MSFAHNNDAYCFKYISSLWDFDDEYLKSLNKSIGVYTVADAELRPILYHMPSINS
jgi:hypothetical protein